MRRLLLALTLAALSLPAISFAQDANRLTALLLQEPVKWGTYAGTTANSDPVFSSATDTVFVGAAGVDTTGPIMTQRWSWTGAGTQAGTSAQNVAAVLLEPTAMFGNDNGTDTLYASVEGSPDGVHFMRTPGNALTYQVSAGLSSSTTVPNGFIVIPIAASTNAAYSANGGAMAAPFIRIRIRTTSALILSGLRAVVVYNNVAGQVPQPSAQYRMTRIPWRRAIGGAGGAVTVDSLVASVGTRAAAAGAGAGADTTAAIPTADWSMGNSRFQSCTGNVVRAVVACTGASTVDSVLYSAQVSYDGGTTWPVTLATITLLQETSVAGKTCPFHVLQFAPVVFAGAAGPDATGSDMLYAPLIRFILNANGKYMLNAGFWYGAWRQ